ncbi:hypothetical protein [Novipirellula caenicola]|uniref:Pyrrolo-quinoline quinone n=1 Tax=Novipirellula caenicola TaxID=1536901 RepID=A0ABP9VVB4_9BACT
MIQNGKPVVVWRADKAICKYASPVAVNGEAYFLSKANVLHCLNIESGEVAYRQRLDGDCGPTPIVANGKLNFFLQERPVSCGRCGPQV